MNSKSEPLVTCTCDADDSSVGRALLPSFDLDDPLLDQPAPLPVGSASTSAGSQIARGDMLQPGHAPAIPPPDPNAQIPAPFFPTMSSGGASGFDVQSYPVGEGEEDEDEVWPCFCLSSSTLASN